MTNLLPISASPRGAGEDFQRPYLESWLRWVSITDIDSVEFRPNLATADAATGRELAQAATRDLAKRLSEAPGS